MTGLLVDWGLKPVCALTYDLVTSVPSVLHKVGEIATGAWVQMCRGDVTFSDGFSTNELLFPAGTMILCGVISNSNFFEATTYYDAWWTGKTFIPQSKVTRSVNTVYEKAFFEEEERGERIHRPQEALNKMCWSLFKGVLWGAGIPLLCVGASVRLDQVILKTSA